MRALSRCHWVAVWLSALLAAASCGGEAVRFQAPPSLTAAPTEAPATTAASGSAGPDATAIAAPTLDPTATCTRCWPLTGRPVAGGSVARRPLVVKLDNAPAGRPHYGISQADLVFEQLVEGYLTRLVAVFHSQDPQTIGSVRSARLVDRSLTAMVQGALVYSGTSAYAWTLISRDAAAGRYVELSADHSGGYHRVPFRQAPYDMFTSASAQREALAKLSRANVADVPRWPFLAAADRAADVGGMAGASAATDVTIPYRQDTSTVTYRYDGASQTYARWQHGAGTPVRDVDAANGVPVAAANVVIIHTEIWEVPEIVDAAGTRAHDMRLLGTGPATVFRDGLRQDGTWSRASDAVAFTFTSARGERIALGAGQTWVHIVPLDWVVTAT